MSRTMGKLAFLAGLILGSGVIFGSRAAAAEKVYARHILFPANEEEKAKEVLDQLKNGEIRWDEACARYSVDIYTKHAGGRLGAVTARSRLAEALKNAALKLEENSYAPEPIKTKFGWHILYVSKREEIAAPEKKPAEKTETPKAEEVKKPKARVRVTLSLTRRDPTIAGATTLEITVTNTGKEPARCFRPELLPLGVILKCDPPGEKTPEIKADYKKKLDATAAAFLTLLPDQAVVQKVRVSNTWDNVGGEGFWEVDFSGRVLVNALEADKESAFVKDLKKNPDYPTVKETWNGITAAEKTGFDYHMIPMGEEFYKKDFYVLFTMRDGSEFLVKLSNERNYGRSVRHFIRLVRQGFYEKKSFYKVQEGEFVSAGARNWIEGDWRGLLTTISSNLLDRVSVKEKDFVLLARPRDIKYEEGGNFLIALKDLAEYKRTGIPVGKVVGGWEVVQKIGTQARSYSSSKVIQSARLRLEDELADKWSNAVRVARGPAPQKGPLPLAQIETKNGTIELELYEDDAPNTVANFIELAEKGFYNGLTFHRVESWVVQGGDPTGTGRGGPGYKIKDEVNGRTHVLGAVGMAKTNRPNSAGSQFYICKKPAFHLDRMGQYTVFGKVIKGMDVVDKIEKGDKIVKVTITRKRDHKYVAEKIGGEKK